MRVCVSLFIYIYIYIYVCMYVCIMPFCVLYKTEYSILLI